MAAVLTWVLLFVTCYYCSFISVLCNNNWCLAKVKQDLLGPRDKNGNR